MAGPQLPTEGTPYAEAMSGGIEDGSDLKIAKVLDGYRAEAVEARMAGPHARDGVWDKAVNLYWNRNDFSGKKDWQSKVSMPEVPGFVDRFAAALKEALLASADSFYTVSDPADAERDMSQIIKRVLDVWLSRCGRSMRNGHAMGFETVFEEQIKLGTLKAMCSVVTWKDKPGSGRVAIETVDPSKVWFDPLMRGLYRIRSAEIDLHELDLIAKMERGYDRKAIKALRNDIDGDLRVKQARVTGVQINRDTTTRTPVTLDEYIATVVMEDGEVVARDALIVVARCGDKSRVIRGPSKNPFWHGDDWLVYTPLITVPMSPYGRTYTEDLSSVSNAFTELTNIILDAVYMTSMKVFAAIPEMMRNPNQLEGGVKPGKIFELEDGAPSKDFMMALDLGNLPPEAINVWQALKGEMREAADINEIGLGQFAPNSRTSATEVVETQQSSSALIRSIASTVEQGWIDPTLDLMWKTGMQYMKPDDSMIRNAAGDENFDMLFTMKKDFVQRPITFQARGISSIMARADTLRKLLQLLQVVASSQELLAAFMQKVDIDRLVSVLFELSNIDMKTLQASPREQLMKSLIQPMQEMAGGGAGGAKGSPPALSDPAQAMANATGAAKP